MGREGEVRDKNDYQVSGLWTGEMLASFSETEDGKCAGWYCNRKSG